MEQNNSGSCCKGVLYVVGTGPGSADYLTPAARKAIEKAEVIVGYKTYLELISEMIAGKEVLSSAMMQEVERVKTALETAEKGKMVVLVSGGDPGIYAMAGLVYDIAAAQDSQAEIKIVAGIAALNSCAERLGAPLMHDFASISLSDLLTPWALIEKRLEAASSADFVIAIYNPKSKKRTWQLKKACEIIMKYRDGSTPAGIVRSATRENEKVILTTLAKLDPEDVDMQSTVIIGNSNTYVWRGKMVTPRGYSEKYELA